MQRGLGCSYVKGCSALGHRANSFNQRFHKIDINAW